MTARTRIRQKGAALLAVIWGVFVLTAIAFALSASVRGGSEELRARKEHLQAYYVARGAVYRSISMLKQQPPNANTPMPFRAGQSRIEWDDMSEHIAVDVFDETGKVDVNTADPAMLERLFMNLGMDYMPAHYLVAAIQDWRDPDDQTRMGGAESLYYQSLPQPYSPANQDLKRVEDLLLVRGVTPELFYGGYQVDRRGNVSRRIGLIDCLTTETHSPTVNINYAPLPVLMSVPGMTPEVAQMMIEGRARKPFASVSDFIHDYPVLLSGETMSHLSAGSMGPYTLVASARTQNGITAKVRAVVKVNGLNITLPDGQVRIGPPFLITQWDDSYVR